MASLGSYHMGTCPPTWL